MDRTSLYRALDPMARDGLVAVEAAPRGRSRIASLTEAGRRAMDDAAVSWEAAQASFVEAFGRDAWQALHAMLLDATAVATRLNGRPDARVPGGAG